MTRFAWLQIRTQTLVGVAALAIVAVVAAVTGVHASHQYANIHAHCQVGCDLAISRLQNHYSFEEHAFDLLSLLTPVLLGAFWGAPLIARELESGTYRLAWTQGVTRSRWTATKLVLGAVTTALVTGAITLAITWWYRLPDQIAGNQYAVFDHRDIVPIGYALFAFATGALIGALLRRTVAAMATTIGLFAFARIATTVWLRPRLLSPLHKTMSILDSDRFGIRINGSSLQLDAQGTGPGNSWTTSSHIISNATGRVASTTDLTQFVQKRCPGLALPPPAAPGGKAAIAKAPDQASFDACRTQAARMYHLAVSYQPANRYWTFQSLETAIFGVLALVAAAGCYWWVTRRTS